MIKLLEVYHKDKSEKNFTKLDNDFIFKKDIFDSLVQASDEQIKNPNKNIIKKIESPERTTIMYYLKNETYILVYSR